MKKVLSFVLVLAMVLGSVAMAFAVDYSDVAAEDKYAEAIGTLSNLGVLNGYEDGTFKADRTIKRSEFAKVVVEALGLKPSAASATQFSDVEAGKWYTPYVALAAQLGIVNGFGDGTFRPEQTITDTQAIVMVVRALGYTDDYFGGYNAAKYISHATYLGLMGDVNAGTGASTRGNVAQLVFNALDVPRVTVDKDGNARTIYTNAGTTEDTMKTRLSGSPYDPDGSATAKKPGDAFLYDGSQALAAGANMSAYLGKYITATADANNAIKGVSTVVSTTLVGKWDGTSKFVTDATSYTFYNASVDYTTAMVPGFTNGASTGAIALSGTSGEVSLEVAVSGTVITTVYSISSWTPQGTFQYAKDSLDATARTLKGASKTFNFTPDKVGKIDESKFAIAGVDKLSDIAVDNIVTVYQLGTTGNVVKIEVGTKTAEGQVTEKTSAGKYIVGGAAYSVNADGTAPALGDKGTFLLAYDGTIFAAKVAEAAAVAEYYGIELQMVNGTTGINTSEAKVQLVTADGSKSVLTGDSTAAKNGQWTPSALVTGNGNTTDVAVKYTLNANGQIHSIEAFSGASVTAADVAKDGTIKVGSNNYKLTANTKLLVKKAAQDYAAGKASDYYGAKVTLSAVATKGTEVLFAVVDGTGANAAAGNYVMLNGWTTKYAASGNYNEITVLEAGAAKSYKLPEAGVAGFTTANAVAASNGALQNFTVDTTGYITAVAPVAASTAAFSTKTAVENGFLVTDGPSAMNYPLANNVVVYVWKSNAWTVGSTTDLVLAANNGEAIKLYDINANVNGADVVTIAR